MSTHDSSLSTKFRVGIFTLLGLLLIGAVTVYVNDRPFWWRSCQLVNIKVADATGLRTKSPIRSLGLQIGFLKAVDLYETYVNLSICITAPVEVLPETMAYIRSEGFLGDKFVELKPVKYIGTFSAPVPQASPTTSSILKALDYLIPSAYAQDPRRTQPSREVPMAQQSQDIQNLVNEVDTLVGELTNLTGNLKKAFDPDELQKTLSQLNKTLENASRTLSPEGNLTTTAQRALAKLEDAIEQMRDQLTRINQGEGSVGRVLNDPIFAEELEKALKNLNTLLNTASRMRLIVDLSAQYLPAYSDGRGGFKVGIWPKKDRYYLLGVGVDPRGKVTTTSKTTTTTTVASGGATSTKQTQEEERTVENRGLLFTVMMGKILWERLDLSAGILFNDAATSAVIYLGSPDWIDRFQVRSDLYFNSSSEDLGSRLDSRLLITAFPADISYFRPVYITAGIDGFRKVNGKFNYFVGGGISFDDEDVKLFFTLLR